ncbi:kinase-like domain-containing protein [Sporodiniella umbellata]|nr:kinase-like domain-containing protein [Sporodiniella umbellata]
MNIYQRCHDEEAKEFLSSALQIQLPKGSLQDILKDGTLLCDLISALSPGGHIIKNDGKTKFAYQDNIGQFLREAERLHIPQSDLFQTVDLLEGKRMQSVVSCLLAIQRITRDRKLIPNVIQPKQRNRRSSGAILEAEYQEYYILPKTTIDQNALKICVQSPTASVSPQTPPPSPPDIKIIPSEIELTEQIMTKNRKASLKKMGSCAITVKNEDGTYSVYALGKSIGKGQFGEVFGGLNMDTGEYVAIKRIKRNQLDCDDMNEVGVLRHLNHEHIVRYKGFSKDKIYVNIILEYAEMGSLLNNIKSFGKFPEKLAASYTYKILSGLDYLHSQQVVHCDLKAANILTTKSGSLKLTDFGVSLTMKMKEDETTGSPAGTPNWMAPEVIKLAGACTKSDIWSLGCTIVEMLTGKPPYSGMHSFAALYKIVEDEELPIPKNLELSEEARDFLSICFKKCPEDRPSAFTLMKHKWMTPFFQKEKNPAVRKCKSYNALSCSHDRIISRYNIQTQTCSTCYINIDKNIQSKQCKVKKCTPVNPSPHYRHYQKMNRKHLLSQTQITESLGLKAMPKQKEMQLQEKVMVLSHQLQPNKHNCYEEAFTAALGTTEKQISLLSGQNPYGHDNVQKWQIRN